MASVTRQPRQCINCRFFRRNFRGQLEIETLQEMEAGLCCRHAPRPAFAKEWNDVEQNPLWARFPVVDEQMVCGEFQEAKEEDEY